MKNRIDWYCIGIILVIILVISFIIGSMISYMSLNNWDIRCVFTDCKIVRQI